MNHHVSYKWTPAFCKICTLTLGTFLSEQIARHQTVLGHGTPLRVGGKLNLRSTFLWMDIQSHQIFLRSHGWFYVVFMFSYQLIVVTSRRQKKKKTDLPIDPSTFSSCISFSPWETIFCLAWGNQIMENIHGFPNMVAAHPRPCCVLGGNGRHRQWLAHVYCSTGVRLFRLQLLQVITRHADYSSICVYCYKPG